MGSAQSYFAHNRLLIGNKKVRGPGLVGPAVSTFPHFRIETPLAFRVGSQKEKAKILSAAMCAVMIMT